jgi:hypothetical protein
MSYIRNIDAVCGFCELDAGLDLEQKQILAGYLLAETARIWDRQTLARGFSHYRAASVDLPTS